MEQRNGTMEQRYEAVPVEGGVLEAWSAGSGDPVLVIHGAVVPDVFGPMIDEPTLADYRFVGYRRRAYAGSAPVSESSIESYAGDALAVMTHFGLDRAHVVAHSFGGRIGLEVARQAPERVQSLALLEGGGASDLVVPSAPSFLAGAGASAAALQEGDRAGALDKLLVAIGGEGSREAIDAVLGDGWYDQAVADIGTVFQHDLSSSWTLTLADLEAISTPTLVMIGDQTIDFFRETSEALYEALPNSEVAMAPGANHWMQMTRPDAIAPLLAGFLERNALG